MHISDSLALGQTSKPKIGTYLGLFWSQSATSNSGTPQGMSPHSW
jgi:hypothetical protein